MGSEKEALAAGLRASLAGKLQPYFTPSYPSPRGTARQRRLTIQRRKQVHRKWWRAIGRKVMREVVLAGLGRRHLRRYLGHIREAPMTEAVPVTPENPVYLRPRLGQAARRAGCSAPWR